MEGRVSREMCRNAAKLVQITRERIRQNVEHVNDISTGGFLASGKPSADPLTFDVERYRRDVSQCREPVYRGKYEHTDAR